MDAEAVAWIAAVISFFAFLASVSQAQSAKTQAGLAQGQAQDSQAQADIARQHAESAVEQVEVARQHARSAEEQVAVAKRHAEAAEKQVDVAHQQVEVAREQLRIFKEDRDAQTAKALAAQAQRVFLEPGANALGPSRGGQNPSRAEFALKLINQSEREILEVEASIRVDRSDGSYEVFDFREPRLNPGMGIAKKVVVTGRPDDDPAQWVASTFAEFTDTAGQFWMIDASGMRIGRSA